MCFYSLSIAVSQLPQANRKHIMIHKQKSVSRDFILGFKDFLGLAFGNSVKLRHIYNLAALLYFLTLLNTLGSIDLTELF
jgi:hypothetical protein